jgi:hypothetical protein
MIWDKNKNGKCSWVNDTNTQRIRMDSNKRQFSITLKFQSVNKAGGYSLLAGYYAGIYFKIQKPQTL